MRPTDIQPESDDSTNRETRPTGAQVPADLHLQIKRIAYQKGEPGGQTVTPSEVARTAFRFYVEHYSEDVPTAEEAGVVRAVGTIYGEELAVGDR